MKKFLLVILGVCLTLIVGFFWFANWVFLPFEHRENYNGVGWPAFAQSIRKHVDDGAYTISDFGHYEGSVNFTVTDGLKNSYHTWTSRSAYADARNMQTLKTSDLRIKAINGLNLVCTNNFDEDVRLFASRKHLRISGNFPKSLNEMFEVSGPLVSSFGKNLPQTYYVSEGQLIDLPDGLSINIKSNSRCCSQKKTVLGPTTSIFCKLD